MGFKYWAPGGTFIMAMAKRLWPSKDEEELDRLLDNINPSIVCLLLAYSPLFGQLLTTNI